MKTTKSCEFSNFSVLNMILRSESASDSAVVFSPFKFATSILMIIHIVLPVMLLALKLY